MTRRIRRIAAGLLVLAAVAAAVEITAPAAVAAPGPSASPEYYFDQWDVPALWAAGARGQNIVIAELDTGVNAALPELAGKVLPGTDYGTPGGDGGTDRDTDRFGHGTAMASIMVARPGTFNVTGLAPDAQILPIALPLAGTQDEAKDDQLPAAIRYAADHGAKIISMSLGEERKPGSDPVPCPAAEQEAIYYALSQGAVLVAAGGNQGDKGSPVVDPGVCFGVVSVGAVDRNGRVPSFSSRHPYLTLTAPGVNIPSLSRIAGSAYSGDGTSQATALTSAALALAWSVHPELSGRALVARLLATLTPGNGQTAGEHSDAFGGGLLDAGALVQAQIPADAPNALYAAADPFVNAYRASLTVQGVPDAPPASAAPTDLAVPVGSPPSRFTRTVWLGGVIAVVGLLVTLVAGVGLRHRRNFWRASVASRVGAPKVPGGSG